MNAVFYGVMAVTGTLLGIFQASFLPSFSRVVTAIDLPLLLICWLIMRFRFREAMLVAIVSGLTMDALSFTSLSRTFAYAVVAWSAWLLFTRIFTNRSWPGLLGLATVTYALLHLITLIESLWHAAINGLPLSLAYEGSGFGSALAALGLQLIATVMVLLLVARLRAGTSVGNANH